MSDDSYVFEGPAEVPAPRDNNPPLSISELSFALKRTLEDRFGHVRVRGELGAVKVHSSGHVYLDIKDLDGQRGEVDDAVAVGFDIKVALHPTQVTVIRDGYRPSAEQLQWARRVLDAAASQRGAFGFEGIMVDAPVLRRAERILTLAP